MFFVKDMKFPTLLWHFWRDVVFDNWPFECESQQEMAFCYS